MFAHRIMTDGEQLCRLLHDNVVASEFWIRFQDRHLCNTGRSEGFRQFFQELLAINLTRRLILAAEYAKQFVNAEDAGFLAYLDPSIESWGLRRLNANGQLARLVRRSVIAANHSISMTL